MHNPSHKERSHITTLEFAKRYVPGARTVVMTYGKIPGYRDPTKPSWGFEISDSSATVSWFDTYTCPRNQAKKLFETSLKPEAEKRGFVVKLVVLNDCGLNPDLTIKV